MSTFKCGLRRFDGHGTSSYRPTNPAATKEMESAFSKMMRERELQDSGCFGCIGEQQSHPVKQVQLTQISKKEQEQQQQEQQQQQQQQQSAGECYSLSDSPSKKTE